MQHRGDADAGAQMLGVGRDRAHRLGRGLEQEIVDDGLVLVGDGGNPRRQREDDVEVRDRAAVRPCAPPSTRALPRPDTWGNADCGSCYRRSVV